MFFSKNLLILLIHLLLTTNLINSQHDLEPGIQTKFNCRFNTDFDWLIIGRVYMCTVTNNISITSKNFSVTSVSGEHRIFKNNNHIFALWFLDKELYFIPNGLTKFFRHIAGIVINRCQLKEIHQNDLAPFYKLREFYLIENDIEVLEEGLFEFNKRLELLWLDGNKIKKINPNIFDVLNKLRFLNFREKNCTLKKIQYDREAVEKIVSQMKKKCLKIF